MSCLENWLSEISEYLEFRRGADLEEDSYLYLHEKWYEILETGGSWALGSLAGAPHYLDRKLEVEPERLYVTIPPSSPVRFWCGQPLSTTWPDKDLIYVEEAYRRVRPGHGVDTSEKVHGLFLRKWDAEEGTSYYAPLDSARQGIPDAWILDEDLDLIVSWRQITTAAILKAAGE